ncbi:nucleolar complex protein 3 homolog [Uranotaenia lowii]|uniref:nucleolar complex protein 3 homolog n=1 Tax=Uranotaenia lowii TaxID=190385 RepID=UPI0024796F97|nr:nucleolar complex protein 3 homolog [Uranotaenia lowii]
MPIRKKIKISSAKRGHHEKHKKNFAKTKNALNKEKQMKANSNIFKNKRLKEHLETTKVSKKRLPVPETTMKRSDLPTSEVQFEDFEDMMDSLSETGSNQENNENMSDMRAGSPDSAIDNEELEMEDGSNAIDRLEEQYQQQVSGSLKFSGERKDLLPIKTKKGDIVVRSLEIFDQPIGKPEKSVEENEHVEPKEADTSATRKQLPAKTEVATTDLLLERDEEIERQKFLIGVTCASILETPETKIKNLASIIELIPEQLPTNGKVNMFVIRKLAMISVVEVFKDIIPEYRLGIIDASAQKLKKTTLARVNYENELLLQYKKFLVHCESYSQIAQGKKSYGSDGKSMEKMQIAETAIQCMCDLLVAHPYFNFGLNIGQMLVTYLNSNLENIRKCVYSCFVNVFKTDSRFDISKHIIRHINQLVKKKEHNVYAEVVSCLKYLQIKDVNIEAEKEKELKLKKLEAHKSRVINMSRQERKRKKKLQELEKELFETKAEESKQIKHKKLTDVTKLVFTIYFRILKSAPKSKVLSATLEGLAKFAHIINIEFFSDLVELLNNLLVNENLGYREQLHCIQTVFTVLRGQGEILNIDPARFYTHLYKNLLRVHGGKNHEDLESILPTLDTVLLKRRNNITYHRYLAFVKRLSMMSLQVLHNGALGCLGVIKSAMQLNSSLDILLDTESTVGSGKFDPNVEEPEFSNASSTSLYELTALHRHYHPTVRKMANNIANGVPSSGVGMLPVEIGKLSPVELFHKYDSSKMAFNPSIAIPQKKNTSADGTRSHIFTVDGLEEYCQIMQNKQYFDKSFNFLENKL